MPEVRQRTRKPAGEIERINDMSKKEKIGIILLGWAGFINQPSDGTETVEWIRLFALAIYIIGMALITLGGDN